VEGASLSALQRFAPPRFERNGAILSFDAQNKFRLIPLARNCIGSR